ncbi:helix-turn-helix domain-containing protein [Embleya sp. NPDC059237]|uniref:helix-turn-helix domain-containing protein n=1 Tax=Embleya sp. NPDC059237 TaxID=3346784 RepID=UPI0036D11508
MVPTDTLHVTRHTSALGSIATVSAPAHPALAPLFGAYLGYDEHTHAPLRRREPATGSITVIIGFVPIRVHSPHAGPATPGTTRSFVAGLHDGPTLVEHDGRQAGIQLDLTPLGAYTLLGLPLAEIADRVVHLDDLPGWDGDALVDRLMSAPDWSTRFTHLDEILLRRLAIGPEPLPEVIRSWDLLTASAGRIDVTTLAREIGWSRRRLGARFRETVGLPPKKVARVLRFRHAIALLEGTPRSWAEVAAEAGYYDQAHFNRDFKVLAGCTPGAHLGSRLPTGGFAA